MTRRVSIPIQTAAALVAATLFSACTDPDTSAGDDPAPSGSTESSPAQPTPNSSGWTPIEDLVETDGLLPAGRLGMTANGRPDAPWAVVEVPAGFSTIDGWVIFDENPAGGGGVGYWTVSEVVRDPCSDSDPIDAGSTVEDLVAAFQKQRLTRVTEAVPVSVDGYQGQSLELHVPDDADFAACPDFNVWESDPAGARHLESLGDFDRLWILDVDGEVVVLTVTADQTIPESALDRLAGMVESAEFVARS